MMESITVVAAIDCPPRHQPKSAKEDALRMARTCYDHFAGRFGVALADALVVRDFIKLTDCGGEVTPAGMAFFRDQKVELDAGRSKRVFCRPCLDWSDLTPFRRVHGAECQILKACQQRLTDRVIFCQARSTR